MRAGLGLLLIALSASCGNNVVTCNLDEFIAADIAGRSDILDCGQPLSDPDAGSGAAAWAAAQRCALDAVAAARGSTPVYDVPDPIYHQDLRAGYTGVPAGTGELVVRAYAFSGDRPMIAGDANPSVSEISCAGTPPLVDTNTNPKTPCTPDVGRTCLTCNSAVGGALLCGFQP
jgi:hypothetical protein